MSNIIESLNQGIKARITLGEDDICKSCLNFDGICSNSFVTRLDTKVSDLLELKSGDVVDFNEKLDILKTKLTSLEHKQICSECIWMKKGLCVDTFKQT